MRVQTFYYNTPTNLVATLSWSRQDSYFEPSNTAFTNTGSSGVVLDQSLSGLLAANDGNYVFAMYDGINGFSINHFGTRGTLLNPTVNSTAGTGSNTPTASLSTYSSTNMCLGSNLLLEGTTDTSSLSTTITDWSDGYKATSTLNLETFLGGALASWRGVCMVYYSS